jgi:hypothetical protein
LSCSKKQERRPKDASGLSEISRETYWKGKTHYFLGYTALLIKGLKEDMRKKTEDRTKKDEMVWAGISKWSSVNLQYLK